MKKTILLAAAAVGLGLIAGPALAENLFADVPSGEPDIVATADGKLRGYAADGVATFLGIPYAAPPVGELRWQPPSPPQPWQETRDAGEPGASCVQTQTYGVFAARSLEEDCLTLNVFAPAADSRDTARPVMVWIHGGGLVNGRASDFDARKLVRDGDVVVVAMNYRLNVFGYFSHPALDAEGHDFGNYGTMDQQAALRWVKENIAEFGGDPGNVTLFGESAGGLAALFNVVSPAAEGLFHKMILESGVSAAPQTPLDAAQKSGLALSEALGCTDPDAVASCMRGKSVEELEAAGRFTGRAVRVVDGTVLPGQMQELLASGDYHQMPMIIGNNHDEWTWFISFGELASGKPLAAEDYEKSFAGRFGPEAAARIVQEYPLADFPSPSVAASVAGTAGNFVCPSLKVMNSAAAHGPLFVYEFMDDEAPYYFEDVSYPYGAAHTLELQYIFPMFHGTAGTPKPLSDAQERLSDAMVAYWTNFARTGNPNGEGLPQWPQWTPEAEQIQLLDVPEITTASDTGVDRKCAFWNAL